MVYDKRVYKNVNIVTRRYVKYKKRGVIMKKSNLERLTEEMGVVLAEEKEFPQEEAEEVMIYGEQGETAE